MASEAASAAGGIPYTEIVPAQPASLVSYYQAGELLQPSTNYSLYFGLRVSP